MLSRVTVLVLVLIGCGFDLALESLRQRELRYEIQDVDQELGYAELRLHSGRTELQRSFVDTAFGRDADFIPAEREQVAAVRQSGNTTLATVASTDRGRR